MVWMGGVVLLKIGCKFVELAPPINLSQHSFCRWLPQHKINCSYIHLKYSSDPELKIYKFKWFRKDLYDETVFPLFLPLYCFKIEKSQILKLTFSEKYDIEYLIVFEGVGTEVDSTQWVADVCREGGWISESTDEPKLVASRIDSAG